MISYSLNISMNSNNIMNYPPFMVHSFILSFVLVFIQTVSVLIVDNNTGDDIGRQRQQMAAAAAVTLKLHLFGIVPGKKNDISTNILIFYYFNIVISIGLFFVIFARTGEKNCCLFV